VAQGQAGIQIGGLVAVAAGGPAVPQLLRGQSSPLQEAGGQQGLQFIAIPLGRRTHLQHGLGLLKTDHLPCQDRQVGQPGLGSLVV
jgi:hypothetical protein